MLTYMHLHKLDLPEETALVKSVYTVYKRGEITLNHILKVPFLYQGTKAIELLNGRHFNNV